MKNELSLDRIIALVISEVEFKTGNMIKKELKDEIIKNINLQIKYWDNWKEWSEQDNFVIKQ